MHEYEIFIEDINPCGGEQYSKKSLIRRKILFDFLKNRKYNDNKRVASKRKSSLPATRFFFKK